jgi:hypothetical protein
MIVIFQSVIFSAILMIANLHSVILFSVIPMIVTLQGVIFSAILMNIAQSGAKEDLEEKEKADRLWVI